MDCSHSVGGSQSGLVGCSYSVDGIPHALAAYMSLFCDIVAQYSHMLSHRIIVVIVQLPTMGQFGVPSSLFTEFAPPIHSELKGPKAIPIMYGTVHLGPPHCVQL